MTTGKRGGAKTITEDQEATLVALIEEVKADKQSFLKYMKVSNLSLIPATKYADAVAALEKKRRKPQEDEKGGK